MTTSLLKIVESVLSLEVDVFTTNPTGATVTAVGGNVRTVLIPMADRMRIVAYAADGATVFTGIFGVINTGVTSITVIAATDAGGAVAGARISWIQQVETERAIWPVLLSTAEDGQMTFWLGISPDLLSTRPVSPYNDPWSSVYGMTPPSGHEVGILFPWYGERVEAAAEISVTDPTTGAVVATVPSGALGYVSFNTIGGVQVDWDDYAAGAVDNPANLTVISDDAPAVPETPTNEGAPVISDVSVTQTGNTSARIAWTTDIPATSRVQYGATSSYGSVTEEDEEFGTTHSVDVTGLTQGLDYHFQAQSENAAGESGISADQALSMSVLWSTAGCTFSFASQLPAETTLQPINPWVILKYSDDGGFSWSNEMWRPVGRIGEYKKFLDWNRLGRASDRVFWVEVSDPCKWTIVDAYVNPKASRQ